MANSIDWGSSVAWDAPTHATPLADMPHLLTTAIGAPTTSAPQPDGTTTHTWTFPPHEGPFTFQGRPMTTVRSEDALAVVMTERVRGLAANLRHFPAVFDTATSAMQTFNRALTAYQPPRRRWARGQWAAQGRRR